MKIIFSVLVLYQNWVIFLGFNQNPCSALKHDENRFIVQQFDQIKLIHFQPKLFFSY